MSESGRGMDNQGYYWTPEWQEGESQASIDIADGNYYTFNTAQEAIDYLHFIRDSSTNP